MKLRSSSQTSAPFSAALPALMFLVMVFSLTFVARMIFSPLMVAIKQDLAISHAQAGRLFLLLALGLAMGQLSAGTLSARMTYKRMIAAASIFIGLGLLLAGMAQGLGGIRAALLAVGFGAGLYLPAGMALITVITEPRHWGKALSVHEIAPNLSYVMAPLLAEAMVAWLSWRAGLGMLGVGCLIVGAAFLARFRHGRFHGEPLSASLARHIMGVPAFWLLMLFMSMAMGASLGPYTMLPLYLTDLGWPRSEANQLLALSRISGLPMVFLAGWLTDRLGVRWTIGGYLAACGLLTALLGLTSGPWLVAVALIQPAIAVSFFPAGFTAISRIFEARVRGASVALMTPFTSLTGAGLVPAALGIFGDNQAFGLGYTIQGCIILSFLALLPLLRVEARNM